MIHCPQCAIELDPRSPLGLCPVCSLKGLELMGQKEEVTGEIPGIKMGKLLGQGAFGKVFEGQETTAGFRRVAIKILSTDQPGFHRARFLEEMSILAKLNHSHLATLYRSGKTSGGNPYYVMELVDGEPLDQWAKGKSRVERMRVFSQVVEAVAYAHEKGVAHRDLKPANILVSRERSQVKVIDFGIARAMADESAWGRDATMVGQRMGTPRYMSPEQLAGDATVDLRSDLWSLGLILYELILERPVLAGVTDSLSSWEGNSRLLRRFVFPELPQREMDWIARKACALDRGQRYQNATELLHDLQALDRGEAVSVGLSHRSYRFRKSLSKHRLAWLSGVFVFLLLLSLAIGSWMMMREEQRSNEEIASSLAREKEQLALATRAEEDMRRASSDTALLASVRAMNSRQFREARRLLARSLELWPENMAARFSSNYLDAILPEPKLLETRELSFPVLSARADPKGGFLLQSSEERWFHMPLEGDVKAVEKPQITSGKLPAERRFTMTQDRDLVEFRDRDSQDLILAPLLLESASKKVTFSYLDSRLLVHDGSGKVELWEAGDHLSSFRETESEEEFGWLEFSRESPTLWLGNSEGDLYKWGLGEELDFVAPSRAMLKSSDPWKIGEGHDRGIPEDVSALVLFFQVNMWQLGGASKKITYTGNARNRERVIVARQDSTVWIREPGSRFKQVVKASGKVTGLAIGAEGKRAVVLVDSAKVEIIHLDQKEVIASWKLPAPSSEVTMLDTGEIVVSHLDGTISTWDAADPSKPKALIRLASNAPEGLHLRVVPRKPEFLACLDGDVVIHHLSAETGKSAGAAIRHERGLYWMLFAGNGDFLVSIDQAKEGKGALRVWSLRLGSEIVPAIEHPDRILWVSILDNGRRIATSCADKRVRRWLIDGSRE